MTMLHIVNKSPFDRNSFSSCLSHTQEGDSILMIEDATVAALENTSFSDALKDVLKDKKVYVLGGDLAARGINENRIITGIEIVDYSGFVDLTVSNDKTQSWL